MTDGTGSAEIRIELPVFRKRKAARDAAGRFEHFADPATKEWIDEILAALRQPVTCTGMKMEILAKYAENIIQAQPKNMQDRLNWLLVEAEKNGFTIALTIKPDGAMDWSWQKLSFAASASEKIRWRNSSALS